MLNMSQTSQLSPQQIQQSQMISSVLPKEFNIATTAKEISDIIDFRKDFCSDDRPSVYKFHDDGFDNQGIVLYVKNAENKIISSARLLFDTSFGFPEEDIFPNSINDMRINGKTMMELGRLVILENRKTWLRKYYKVVYDIAIKLNVDYILMIMKKRNYNSHKNVMNLINLSNDMGNSWDEEQAELCLTAWDILGDQPEFFKWMNRENKSFKKKEWDQYSPFHLGVLVSIQNEVYEEVSQKIKGKVADMGCGSGRIMGYIKENPDVDSYTGVDFSEDMIKQASWLKEKLEFDEATLMNSKIEHIDGEFDAIISMHSYYAWPNQKKVLEKIYQLLIQGGQFILVTPNNQFDVEKLSQLVSRELLGHPFYEQFLEINHAIAEKADYFSTDYIIGQVREVGFKVVEAHQKFFLGGATYLQLEKL